ncbi:4'-phosphopantetheinyl transferase family protein [Streptomyces europaeiscabiei]|uniref:4'-phosphopantetheinyl transferase family protein n=1 Tax=Streptomyces europaeiscabiei TaxID=146819 RepID=UPI0006283F4D|nr:4'-phosphopantetheinyl transferase superfamily protein [Streptomyces europaeiscabiei]MDX2531386.1 4'-phosphopantetheinyl transferase superfamily protein [Streptomyces europaeiscabiei]MDX2765371.1 4'-phosphopantetheinyl transferase superfamily protein [Streptomyces europaeiscabiei]MDX2774740.1 4'-phosphopantetheinyl transferase superfamily protein [Streptomyces europaeiscabiei]MDX3673287.1 4'-phosphopantetheinyl transferase superfamily protein [Streptomyces europaeiscabiei]MDX3716233.1 4'-ph
MITDIGRSEDPDRPIQLWFCTNDDLPPDHAALLAAHWFDEEEKRTAQAFLFERDRRQYLVAHTLVRRVLALETGLAEDELHFWRSSRGRPFLRVPAGGLLRGGRQLDFNLSHASGCNLLGVTRAHTIGVDVERLDRDPRSFHTILQTFAAWERHWVAEAATGAARDRRTMRLWTLKEAYAKARGLGLGLPFDSFSFTLAEDRGVLGFDPPADDRYGQWTFVELEPAPDVLAAVVIQTDPFTDPVMHLHRGFPWARTAPHRIALPAPAPVAASPAYR